jgi:hypothetical protein
LRNLQLGIIGGRAFAAKNRTTAIFAVAILMMRHSASGAEDLWRSGLVKSHAAIRADWLGH